jgi:hypothetical protein
MTVFKFIKHKINKNVAAIIMNVAYYLYLKANSSIFFKICFLCFKRTLSLIHITSFHVINHRLYTENHPTSMTTTVVGRRSGFTSNLIFDFDDNVPLLIPAEIADLICAKHKDVRIQGDSDYILNIQENYAINDSAYDLSSRLKMHDGILLDQKGNLALMIIHTKKHDKKFSSGIMLSGKFSSNYYHVIYELLIKLLLLDRIPVPSNVPLVVDSVVFEVESFAKIFETLNNTKREIIIIDKKEIISFDYLYCISPVNIIPAHLKIPSESSIADIRFDIYMLQKMRWKLMNIKSNRKFPAKIFITRRISKRRAYNEDEVISLLKRYDFEVIAPEEYSFAEQIALFNGAQFIIGGSGAAMSNLLFCSEGCKVICLYSLKINVPVFTTIAYAQGVNMRYCIGNPVKKSASDNIHSDFLIDTEKLKNMVESFNTDNSISDATLDNEI